MAELKNAVSILLLGAVAALAGCAAPATGSVDGRDRPAVEPQDVATGSNIVRREKVAGDAKRMDKDSIELRTIAAPRAGGSN